jgi:hypothetical protein
MRRERGAEGAYDRINRKRRQIRPLHQLGLSNASRWLFRREIVRVVLAQNRIYVYRNSLGVAADEEAATAAFGHAIAGDDSAMDASTAEMARALPFERISIPLR